MILINGFEARGLAKDIVQYLEFCEIEIDDDARKDLENLLHFHGGLDWNDIDKHWINPDTDEKMEFDVLTLRCSAV